MKKLNKGDVVKVTKQSKLNSHINSLNYIGIIEELNQSAVQLEVFWDDNNNCPIKAYGAVDIESVDYINPNDMSYRQKIEHSKCYSYVQ